MTATIQSPSRQPMTQSGQELLAVLDATESSFHRYDVHRSMRGLHAALAATHASCSASEWPDVIAEVRSHPLASMLLEDPMTARSRAKWRRYAGDAPLIDLVYGTGSVPPETTPLGAAIYAAMLQSAAPRAVRARKEAFAGYLDATAARVGPARALAVAGGHMREAQHSRAPRGGGFEALYALDQDPHNLEVVEQEQPYITPVQSPVKALLRGERPCEDLDLVYSMGLYDYLSQPVARTLTAALFTLLRSGGQLLVANFHPRLATRAYMEACMDWNLIYRDPGEMKDLAAAIPSAQLARRRVFLDREKNLVFLELTRR